MMFCVRQKPKERKERSRHKSELLTSCFRSISCQELQRLVCTLLTTTEKKSSELENTFCQSDFHCLLFLLFLLAILNFNTKV